jgi:hypothetical protein
MKSAQNQKPKSFAEQEKINAVKKHYSDLIAGRASCVGADLATKHKTYCHRGAGMSDAPPPPPPKPRSPYAHKLWTVVNNSVRKNRWATYYDPDDSPAEVLHEDDGSWADRA